MNLKNEILAHEAWIYCIAVNHDGKIYTGSCDGSLRSIENPLLENCESKIIYKTMDDIESVFVVGTNDVYSGNDKGIVSYFENDKFISRIELSEEVKGLIVEDNSIYTIRDRGMSINTMNTSKGLARVVYSGFIEGHTPISLLGDVQNGKKTFIALATSSGMGIKIAKNQPQFDTLCEQDNCHTMIINAMCGIGNTFYTGDYCGKVKKWSLDSTGKFSLTAELDVCSGICLNCLVAIDEKTVYSGGSDGILRRLNFS